MFYQGHARGHFFRFFELPYSDHPPLPPPEFTSDHNYASYLTFLTLFESREGFHMTRSVTVIIRHSEHENK